METMARTSIRAAEGRLESVTIHNAKLPPPNHPPRAELGLVDVEGARVKVEILSGAV